ncbi:recombinase family protein [Streptomyces sp. NPDC014685]|uniref:recombinase family protein n=1 Tax=Streptomyces sp. NPDC014685 TaxID=3364881 RepID=UPI003702A0B0
MDALAAAGCRKIFADKKSGKNALRPELKACHAFLDAGATLVVPSLDRYGRSLQDLINMVAELRDRGIGFTSLHENLDTTTPAAGSSSTSSPPSRSSSANSSSSAPTRVWPPSAPAAGSAGAPPSPPRKSSRPPATCCPTLAAPSPRSPSSSASPQAPSTTTSPTCANCASAPSTGNSKPVRGRRTPARSFSPGFPVPQLLTPVNGPLGRIPWAHVFERPSSTRSPLVREAAAPAARSYRRPGPRGSQVRTLSRSRPPRPTGIWQGTG